MEDNRDNTGKRIIVILSSVFLVLLILIAWGAFSIIQNIREATGDLVSPVNALGTQSAQLMNPTPTIIPDPVTIIYDVHDLARLETIHYSLEKVITAESNQGDWSFLFGDKLLFVAHGEVIAGIDMEKLEAEDLEVRDGVLYVDLPPAEVFVATLNNDKSYVYDREIGLLTEGDVNLETTARQAAEDAIYQAAVDDGILEQAEINAQNYLVRFFRALGYQEVVFISDGD